MSTAEQVREDAKVCSVCYNGQRAKHEAWGASCYLLLRHNVCAAFRKKETKFMHICI